jgi:hypothetical protein
VNQLSQLTGIELEELSVRVYHASIKFFDAAGILFKRMAATAAWNPVYDDMGAQAAVLMDAGREQSELLRELGEAIRAL